MAKSSLPRLSDSAAAAPHARTQPKHSDAVLGAQRTMIRSNSLKCFRTRKNCGEKFRNFFPFMDSSVLASSYINLSSKTRVPRVDKNCDRGRPIVYVIVNVKDHFDYYKKNSFLRKIRRFGSENTLLLISDLFCFHYH